MTDHDCGPMCNPDTCKVQAGEGFVSRMESAELDDGLPAKCCGRCRDYSDDDGFQRGWCADKHKGVEAVDYCIAFELKTF